MLEEFVKSVGIEFNKLYNSQMRTEAELRAFKDEMRAFKDEMREDRKRMNREWGTIAKKMGTLVEDIISPATRPVIKRYFGCDPVYKSDNLLKRKDNIEYEIDVLVACEEKVFLIEVKSTHHVAILMNSWRSQRCFWKFFLSIKTKI